MAANPFESFIKLELPKRPFLEQDVDEESVIIRRGDLPRQLGGIKLPDGYVLGGKAGKLAAIPIGSSNVSLLSHEEAAPILAWVIEHADQGMVQIVQLFDVDGNSIQADEVNRQDGVTTITFLKAQAGFASLFFS